MRLRRSVPSSAARDEAAWSDRASHGSANTIEARQAFLRSIPNSHQSYRRLRRDTLRS
jgi:hypothetical protein